MNPKDQKNTAIRLNNVVKTYRQGIGRARIREMTPPPFDRAVARVFPKWWKRNTFNALDGVSISVERGTSVGLIGHNGAGKTTTLKVIAGVTEVTSGSVQTRGRIAALIDVVVGFHPELTGRENVFLLGSIHGMSRKEMMGRVDEMIEFAEIGDMLDTPLKRYSSGMISRLGFSVIAQLDADILLIDEVLAVGDANFQNKCIRWLDDYRKGGGTLVFVSHNLHLVRNMTDRVIWFDHGRLVKDGDTAQVVPEYVDSMDQRNVDHRHKRKWAQAQTKVMTDQGMNRWGAGEARLEAVHVGEPYLNGSQHPSVSIEVTYDANEIDQAVFCIGFVDEQGRSIGAANSPSVPLADHGGTVECKIEALPLKTGIYFPVVAILTDDGTVQDHWKLERALVIERSDESVTNGFGPVEISSSWSS